MSQTNYQLPSVEEIQKQIFEHDRTIDVENCPHCCATGDNYGESCSHCGKQLKGYGNGGWFGQNLIGGEKCIHDFIPACEEEGRFFEVCRFCEKFQEVFIHDATRATAIN